MVDGDLVKTSRRTVQSEAWQLPALVLALALTIGACSSDTIDTTAPPTTTSSAAPTTTATTTTTTTTLAPAIVSPADVVASIEALLASPRLAFTVVQELSLGRIDAAATSVGVLDNADEVLAFTVELGDDTTQMLRSSLARVGLMDTSGIFSHETGILIEVDDSWMQLPPDTVDTYYEGRLGFPVPSGLLVLPQVGLVFDLIQADPGLVENIEPIEETRTVDGRPVPGFTFEVPGTTAAVALVGPNLAQVATLAPVEDTRVTINWWLDPSGRVRAVEILGDDIIAEIYSKLDDAYPGSGIGFLAPVVDGTTVTLTITATEDIPPIEYPDPAIVELADLSDVPGGGLALGPGTCVASYEAVLLPVGDVILDCSTPHLGEIFALFDVPDGDTYPGEDPVFDYGVTLCLDQAEAYAEEEHEVFVLYPTGESWALNDRRIICVFDFAEPQEASVARVVDKQVGSFSLVEGQCLPFGDDLTSVLLPLVDCAEPHGYEVVEVAFLGRWERSYPGDGPIRSEAIEVCDAVLDELDPDGEFISTFFTPFRESWAWGDRVVVCMAESEEAVTGSLLAGTN